MPSHGRQLQKNSGRLQQQWTRDAGIKEKMIETEMNITICKNSFVINVSIHTITPLHFIIVIIDRQYVPVLYTFCFLRKDGGCFVTHSSTNARSNFRREIKQC